MTCIVIALVDETAHVFSDTAHMGPSGIILKSRPKIHKFPDRRFAVAIRGSVLHSFVVGRLARRHRSFEDARERLSRALRGPLGRLLALAGPFEVYVAGTAANGAPAAFMMVSHRLHRGVEPWTAIDIPYFVSTGPAPDFDPDQDPIAFGIRAAQLQRGVLQSLPFARSPVSIVGGALEHVAISADGVRTETLGGWSDRLGERLNPAAKFSNSGSRVQPAKRMNFITWLQPATPWGVLRIFAVGYALNLAVHLVALAPGAIYVERTFHGAPKTTVETGAGTWDAWTRLDLDRLITSPTLSRAVAGAAIRRTSRAADHAEAARAVLASLASPCTVELSREVLRDEYEHTLQCR